MSKKMCNNKTAVLLFLFLAIPLAGANISIPSVSASSGSSIQVPVNIDDATDVGGYNFTVTFDQGVLQATGASSGSLTSGWMLTPNISTPGQITVAGLDISLEGLAGGSGSLVLLNFNVMGNAGSTTNLVFSGNNKINDVNAQNLAAVFQNGSFTVTSYSISGHITLSGGSGSPADISIVLSGTQNGSTNPDLNGDYSFTGLAPGGYTVTPTLAGFVFEPLNRTWPSLSSDISDADFTGSAVAMLTVVSAHGSPVPAVGDHTYYSGDAVSASVPLLAYEGEEGTRHVCSGWTGTGSVPASGSTNSTNFTITQDSSITWNWRTQYLLTKQVLPPGNGAVNANPSGNYYYAGADVELTPAAESGYLFSHWQGDIPAGHETDNPLAISMDAPKTITAIFVEESQELTVNPASADFTFNLSEPDVPVEKNAAINISNTGEAGALNWNKGEVVYNKGSGWITVSSSSGSLLPGNNEEITLTVDRTGLTYGTYTATVPVESNGGNEEITVTVDITTDNRIISIPDTSAVPGAVIQIPVNIDNAEGVGGFGVRITYNQDVLQPLSVSAGTLTGTDAWTLMENINIPGQINIDGVNMNNEPFTEGSGSLAIMNFNVIGIPGDETSLAFLQAIVSTEGASPIPSVAVPGTFTTGGYTISGNVSVTGGLCSATDVLLSLSGSASVSAHPDSQGNYSFTGVMTGSYTVTPSLAGYRFEPVNRSYPDISSHNSSQDFTGIYQPVLTVASPHGSPEPAVGQHTYDYNTSVNASVVSPAGESGGTRYRCTGWTGTGSVPASGTGTSLSFNITQNSTLAYNWLAQYFLNVTVEGNGNVGVDPVVPGSWYDAGTIVALTPVHADGWLFSHWEGDASGSQNPLNVTMAGPMNIKACFIENGFNIVPQQNTVIAVLDDDTSPETLIAAGVEYIGDFTETINLSVSVFPATDKITFELTPGSVSFPEDTFLLDIGISEDVMPDTYIVTVRGQGGSVEKTALITLVINTKAYIPTVVAGMADAYADIPVNVSNACGLKEFRFTLIYDPAMLDMGQALAGITAGSLNPGWIINGDPSIPGYLEVEGAGEEALGSSDDGDSIAIIRAGIIDSGLFPVEGIPLAIEDVLLANEEGQPVPYVTSEGRLFVMTEGDINIDDVVNILDVILCLRVSIGLEVDIQGQSYSPLYPEWLILRTDMNGDGEVNISDVILTLRKSVGLDS